jgi:hypothetical protein
MSLSYSDLLANPRFTAFTATLAEAPNQLLINDFLAEAETMFPVSVYAAQTNLACFYYAAHMFETLGNAIASKTPGSADAILGAADGPIVTSVSVSQDNRSVAFGQVDSAKYSSTGPQSYSGTIWGRWLLQLKNSALVPGAMIT